MQYGTLSAYLKILSDKTRLEILDLLSCEELCGQDLLHHFHISQPTLSHHLKILSESDLVITRRQGNKHLYQLNHDLFEHLISQLNSINTATSSCICHQREECDTE